MIPAFPRGTSDRQEREWTLYERGLQCYYDRAFQDAARYFRAAARLVPDDPITDRFLRRSEHLIEHPPDESWTGVTSFEYK